MDAQTLIRSAVQFVSDLTDENPDAVVSTDDKPFRYMTIAEIVRLFADSMADDWHDMAADEQLDEVGDQGSHVAVFLAADAFLGTDRYGVHAGLYE
jgi:hypothetical protein